jgi:sugar lactone lactonase YvrE
MQTQQGSIDDALRRAYADLADTVRWPDEVRPVPSPAPSIRRGHGLTGSTRRQLIPIAAGLAVLLVVLAGTLIPAALQPGSRQAGSRPTTAPRDVAYFAAGTYDGTGRSSVMPVRLATGQVLPAIPLDGTTGGPAGMVIAPDGKTVYVATVHGQVTPVDTITRTAGPPIWIGGTPVSLTMANAMVMTPDGRTAYVMEAPYGVAVVNLVARKAAGFIKIRGADGFAMTPNGKVLYVVNLDGSAVTPVSTRSNSALRTIHTGLNGVAAAIEMDPSGEVVYVIGTRGRATSIMPGVIVPISTATDAVLAPIITRARGPITISPDGATGYLAIEDGVIPVNLITGAVGKLIKLPVSTSEYQLAIAPSGRLLYALPAPPQGSVNLVFPISTATGTVRIPIELGSTARWLADGEIFKPGGQTLYVLFYPDGDRTETGLIIGVNAVTGQAAKPIRLPGVPLYALFHR